jgi:hypothetical protein
MASRAPTPMDRLPCTMGESELEREECSRLSLAQEFGGSEPETVALGRVSATRPFATRPFAERVRPAGHAVEQPAEARHQRQPILLRDAHAGQERWQVGRDAPAAAANDLPAGPVH